MSLPSLVSQLNSIAIEISKKVQREEELNQRETDLYQREEELDKREAKLDQREQEQNDREDEQDTREQMLDKREEELYQKEIKLDKREEGIKKREEGKEKETNTMFEEVYRLLPPIGKVKSYPICKFMMGSPLYQKYIRYFNPIETELRHTYDIAKLANDTETQKQVVATLSLKFCEARNEKDCLELSQKFLELASFVLDEDRDSLHWTILADFKGKIIDELNRLVDAKLLTDATAFQ